MDPDPYDDDHQTDWRELEGTEGGPPMSVEVTWGDPGQPDVVTTQTQVLRIEVRGAPAPQGSKHGRPVWKGPKEQREFTGKVNMVESSKRVEPWRQRVQNQAEEALRRIGQAIPTFHGPLRVEAVFTVARPKSHFLPANSRRPEPVLRDDAPAYPITKTGDLDKFARACLDALTDAGVWHDDCLIVSLQADKVFPGTGDSLPVPGALIRVFTIETVVGVDAGRAAAPVFLGESRTR